MVMTTDISSASTVSLQASRQYCRQITKQQARNFYYGLALLAEPKKSALFALYAWMRRVDDLADDEDGRTPGQRQGDLDRFQTATHAVFAGNVPDEQPGELWPAFADMVRTYELPADIFDDAIAGHRQDIAGSTFNRFDELREYCYRVAGTVGLASVYIWGFKGGEAARQMAVDRGIALQLTNILRDLNEDAARGRVYLSADDLGRFDLKAEDILVRRATPAFEQLMRFEIERAQDFFERSQPLEQLISPECRPTFNAMSEIYHRLLEKISADPMRVLHERVSLSAGSKIMIAAAAMWKKMAVREESESAEPQLHANGQT